MPNPLFSQVYGGNKALQIIPNW